jgi:uncharacterized protein (TIGR02147 family)
MQEREFYRDCLKRELARRCEKNPRYSLRAYARAMGIDPTAVSRFLSGKQIPSYRLAQQIFATLDFSPEEQDQFLSSLAATHRARGLQRLEPIFRQYQPSGPPADLSVEVFKVISDWYHFAILELPYTEGFESNARWIARELGITPAEAALAVDRLVKLGLLQWKGEQLVRTEEQLVTPDRHVTTPALKRHQKQVLEKAIHSLENDPLERRSMSTMTMAINEKKLPEAKRLIREFEQSLCALLDKGKRTRVYNLGICLYPLQRIQGATEGN